MVPDLRHYPVDFLNILRSLDYLHDGLLVLRVERCAVLNLDFILRSHLSEQLASS